MKKIENAAIIGMGALGTLFGYEIRENLGNDHVAFLMDRERFEKNSKAVYKVNGKEMDFRILTPEQAAPVDLIIVSVKATGLMAALDTMAPFVGEETILVSAVNGVTSEEILSERFGADKVIHAVAQGMDAAFFDHSLTFRTPGKFCIGIVDPSLQEKLDRLAVFFTEAGIPFTVEQDIRHRIWSKFMLNVGVNQVCMVCSTGYGGISEEGSLPRALMISAMREAKLAAEAEGILLTEEDLKGYADLMASLDPDSMPSMAQDRINRKKSEVELFAGTVRRIAAKHGIPVPVNEYLYRRVREIEAEY